MACLSAGNAVEMMSVVPIDLPEFEIGPIHNFAFAGARGRLWIA